jgi:hypothetical protein
MLLLTLRDIYRRQVANFRETIKETLDTLSSVNPIFSGFKKVFGVTLFNTQYPIYSQERTVKTRVSVILDEFISDFSQILDADVQYNASMSECNTPFPLVVDGFEFGNFTLQQLTSLYKMLELKEVSQVYSSIPVRKAEGKWESTSQEGVYIVRNADFASHIHFFPERGASLMFTDNNASTALQGINVAECQLIEFQLSSSALPADVVAQINKRRKQIQDAIMVVIDQASAQEIIPVPKVGAKILNYIHYGDTQGIQVIPY